MSRFATAAPSKIVHKAAQVSRAPDERMVRASAARLRLAAMGATPVTKTQHVTPETTKKRRASPRISLGQLLRAALIVIVACLIVAFPPPGLEKQNAATSVIDAADITAEH